jgi:hypothetical protein
MDNFKRKKVQVLNVTLPTLERCSSLERQGFSGRVALLNFIRAIKLHP